MVDPEYVDVEVGDFVSVTWDKRIGFCLGFIERKSSGDSGTFVVDVLFES